jgi:hypothetical protein
MSRAQSLPRSWGGGPHVPLSRATAERVTGGANADVVYPGSNNFAQWYDNLRFQADISGDDNATVTIGVSADGTFVTPSVSVQLDSQGNGTFHRRTRWPHAPGTKYDLVMRYFYGSTWYDCGGDSGRTDQFLHANVKVHRVKVYNTNSGGYTTTWSSTNTSAIFDHTSSNTPGSNSNTVDGVYGQCGALQANGIDKTQFRMEGISTISIPAGCSDLTQEFCVDPNDPSNGCFVCSAVQTCFLSFMGAANQTNNDNVNVYVVDELGCVDNGVTAGAIATTVDGKRLVVIADELGPDTNIAVAVPLLAHEIRHHFPSGGHVSGAGDNCGLGQNYATKNVMCPDLGRIFTDFQCDQTHGSAVFLDRN